MAEEAPVLHAVNRLLVCLGNMEAKYAMTRHNVGHLLADHFVLRYLPLLVGAERLPLRPFENDPSYGGQYTTTELAFRARVDGDGIAPFDLLDAQSERRRERTRVDGVPFPSVRLHVLKPDSLMNNCGPQVEKAFRTLGFRLKRNPLATNRMDEVAIVHDDTGLPFGTLKCSHQVGFDLSPCAQSGDGNHNGVKSVLRHLPANQKVARFRIGVGRPGARARDYVLGRFSGPEQDVLARELPFLCEVLRIYLFRGMQEAELVCNSAKPFA